MQSDFGGTVWKDAMSAVSNVMKLMLAKVTASWIEKLIQLCTYLLKPY